MAKTYDSHPAAAIVVQRAIEALRSRLPIALDAKQTDVMDFACGTGIANRRSWIQLPSCTESLLHASLYAQALCLWVSLRMYVR
jgi:hypothetical protein